MKIVQICVLVGSILAIGLSGCAAPPPKKTSLEIQAIQSKNFEASKKVSFNSVVSVLQDLGYIVASASLETGFITAESATKNSTDFLSAMAGVRKEQRVAVTATVEEIRDNQSRIRLNFVARNKALGKNGQQANEDMPIHDPQLYANAFDKIGEAIFIRTSQN